ncbi:MAG: hypothetical protein WCA56_15995 [Xanthobacteraceae bacterium]
MATGGTEHQDNDPVTLHRIMQAMIGDGLRQHYQPPQKLSHELFVLLMQLNERERNGNGRTPRPRSRAAAEVRAGSASGASA